MNYDIYSDFDMEQHKATYTNYLEVVIDADGKIMYAIPSHQEKLIALACARLNVSRSELNALCPQEYYYDFLRWLCLVSGAMPVWNDWCEYGNPTAKQMGALRRLKMAGLYRGALPDPSQNAPEFNLKNLLRNPDEVQEDPKALIESLRSALMSYQNNDQTACDQPPKQRPINIIRLSPAEPHNKFQKP